MPLVRGRKIIKGDTVAKGVCGKEVADLLDLLIYTPKGLGVWTVEAPSQGLATDKADDPVMKSLFATLQRQFRRRLVRGPVGKSL